MRKDIPAETTRLAELSEEKIKEILEKVVLVLAKEPNLLRVKRNKITVVGDTHGNLEATKYVVNRYMDEGALIFLGDYVDRGAKEIENIVYLYLLKIRYPNKVFLLRGNHEIPSVNRYYGFLPDVHQKYSANLYHIFATSFAYLPIASLVNEKIFALHGGIAKGLETLNQINKLNRRVEEPTDHLILELLWNDPSENQGGFTPNFLRGGFHQYGKDVVESFLMRNQLTFMIRSHQCFPEGHRYFFNRKLLSIFSCPGYRGDNKGKVALVGKEGKVELNTVKSNGFRGL